MNRAEEGLLRALTRARMYIRKALKETGQFHEARDILLRADENATAAIKAYRTRKSAPPTKPEADLTGQFEKVVQKNLERARKLPRFSKVERTETTFFGVYRNHTFDLRQEGPRNWWYIRVTAPCGSYDYDGWWKDSEDKTVDDAILEAMAGAGMELLTKAASDKP